MTATQAPPTAAEVADAKATLADPSSTPAQMQWARETLADAHVSAPDPTVPALPKLRAKFVVSEITQSTRGVSVVTLTSAKDDVKPSGGTIGAPAKAPVAQVPLSFSAKVAFETSPAVSAGLAVGDAFYLVQA